MTLAVKNHACQPTSEVSPGIDIYAGGQFLGPFARRMAVNDYLAEVDVAVEKVRPNPQKVLILLTIEGNARSHTGVTEKELSEV